MARDEFWDALKEYAHRNHQERVSKNSDRIAYEIIIEMARRVKYELPDGQKFEDTGETGVDYFEIYGNAVQSDDF